MSLFSVRQNVQIKGQSNIVDSGVINTAHYHIEVLPSGGHTAGHVSYLVDGNLFCGDALFSGGCGRVFTGNFAQMFESMQRFNQLPDETVVCQLMNIRGVI